MPQLHRILAAFRAGRLDQAQLMEQLQTVVAVPGTRVDQLIGLAQAEQAVAPLPAPVFEAVLAQLRCTTDRPLPRSPSETLAFLLGDTTELEAAEAAGSGYSATVSTAPPMQESPRTTESFGREAIPASDLDLKPGRDTQLNARVEDLSGKKIRPAMLFAAVAAAVLVGAAAIFTFWPRPQEVPVVTQAPPAVPVAAPVPQQELSVGTVFRDCPTCPLMVVLPPGDLVQGVPANTPGTEPFEVPEHDVFIDDSFAASQYEVTVGEFADFIGATQRAMDGCWKYDGTWSFDTATNWKNAVEGQTAVHPASCVSWDDATAYTQWLSQRTGQQYRLPSAAEWEFAARGGSNATQPWTASSAACAAANVADRTAERRYPGWIVHPCMDTYVQAAPVGSFAANAFGLNDTLGNVFEWAADCWHDNYVGAPADGSARLDGDCSQRELRGGSWFTAPAFVRVSHRNRFAADYRSTSIGFRVVRKVSK